MSNNNDDGGGIILVGLVIVGATILFGSRKKEKKAASVEPKTFVPCGQKKPVGYPVSSFEEKPIFKPNAPRCARCGSQASTSCGRCGDDLCSICVCPNGLCTTCD